MTDWSDPILRRFIVRTEEQPNGCWRWLGHIKSTGYGHFRHPETPLAHRAAWLMLRGPVPEGLELDHLCRNRWCVNPNHLEPVTHRVNVLRGDAAYRNSCEKYHPGEPHRWGRRSSNRRVYCRECNRVREQQRRERLKITAHVQ